MSGSASPDTGSPGPITHPRTSVRSARPPRNTPRRSPRRATTSSSSRTGSHHSPARGARAAHGGRLTSAARTERGNREGRRRWTPCCRAAGAARWSASPPITTPRCRCSRPPGSGRWSRPGSIGRPNSRALTASSRCSCFENRGVEIGVTLAHPHGQIYGYPFVTPFTTAMHRICRRRTGPRPGRNLIADIVAAGRPANGVVAANELWLAFVPFAARWPIEVHLYPRRRVPDLPALSDEERDALVPIYLEVLHRMEGVFDDTLPSITACLARLPCTWGGTTSGCTCACSPSVARSESSSTWPAPSPGWGRG